MNTDAVFYLNSVAFGVGLAMDAFSVSMANGLRQPEMGRRKVMTIAGVFAAFQTVMPLLGWLAVHTAASLLDFADRIIPWISLFLLLFIGGRMVIEALGKGGDDAGDGVGVGALAAQGVATSIDALSVGFTISELGAADAITESLIIGLVTFFICALGVWIGKRFGTKLRSGATLLGGVILMAIGVEIFVGGMIG